MMKPVFKMNKWQTLLTGSYFHILVLDFEIHVLLCRTLLNMIHYRRFLRKLNVQITKVIAENGTNMTNVFV